MLLFFLIAIGVGYLASKEYKSRLTGIVTMIALWIFFYSAWTAIP